MADTAATTASGQPRLMPPQATVVTAAMEDTEDTAAMATGASVQPMLRLSPRPSRRLRPPLWPAPPLMPMLGATEDTTEAMADTATAMAGAKGLLRLMPGATEATG